MTTKINLTSLINYFDKCDSKIAEQIRGLTRQSNGGSEVKKSTSKGFSSKTGVEKTLFEGEKIRTIANVLVRIADELDESDPELALEADNILEELMNTYKSDFSKEDTSEPTGYCGTSDMEQEPAMVLDMSPQMEDQSNDQMEKTNDEDDEDNLPLDLNLDPTPEYDEVTLDQFKDRINGLTFRLTDKDRRSRWESAHELAETAVKYLQKGRELMEKAHGRLDEGGDAIRFKTDFSW